MTVGSTVTIEFEGDDTMTFTLVEALPGAPGREVSRHSPLGEAVMGSRAGITVTYLSAEDINTVTIKDVR